VLQVPLTLDNAAGLAQVRLQLNYDPQLLALLDVSAGPLGRSSTSPTRRWAGL